MGEKGEMAGSIYIYTVAASRRPYITTAMAIVDSARLVVWTASTASRQYYVLPALRTSTWPLAAPPVTTRPANGLDYSPGLTSVHGDL